MPDMEEIRNNVMERTLALLRIHKFLTAANVQIDYARSDADEQTFPGEAQIRRLSRDIMASISVNDLVIDKVEVMIGRNLEQLGSLIARDVIAPVARDHTGPVVMLTSNSYMPPIRDLPDVEAIWRNDNTGEYFTILVEAIESRLAVERVYMDQPEYDNCLYVVDLKRWQHVDENDESAGPGLENEWEPVEG